MIYFGPGFVTSHIAGAESIYIASHKYICNTFTYIKKYICIYCQHPFTSRASADVTFHLKITCDSTRVSSYVFQIIQINF